MGLSETLLFYFLIGAAVGVTAWPHLTASTRGTSLLRGLTAVVFWPVYIPILLAPATGDGTDAVTTTPPPMDDLAVRIAQVERELETALQGSSNWAEEALGNERLRIAELRAAWTAQADRIREMDRVLAKLGIPALAAEAPCELDQSSSGRSRQANLARLKAIRNQAADGLYATLTRVREVVTLIHLARFTGEPASRADELIAEIAASIEGLSEVATWRTRDAMPPGELETAYFEADSAGTAWPAFTSSPCGRIISK